MGSKKVKLAAGTFCLQLALERLGVSKRRVSKLTGIAYPMVIRLSQAGANPTWETVTRIAEALGVGPDAFFWRTHAPPKPN